VKIIDQEIVDRCNDQFGKKEQFEDCANAVKEFLADKPFQQFEQSMYFFRYLQWKWLER